MVQQVRPKLFKHAEQVRAMELLLKHYTSGDTDKGIWASTHYTGCPLCNVIRPNDMGNDCHNCVWVIETGRDCENYADKHGFVESNVSNLRDNNVPSWDTHQALRWRKMRQRQLRRWIEKYS